MQKHLGSFCWKKNKDAFCDIDGTRGEQVMSLIMKNSKISITSLTKATGLSERTRDRIIKSLKEKGILQRIGSKNNSTWEILIKQ